MSREENPWFIKAKELEKQLEEERTKSIKFLMQTERIVIQKMQEIIDQIDLLFSELRKKNGMD
ncbi:hypothetical protein DRN75_03825 [Nanoarchaeota archaeon]|nr:MAG: hypothetical protein DRN75_03825 [Nanoarchaeota archaeon]